MYNLVTIPSFMLTAVEKKPSRIVSEEGSTLHFCFACIENLRPNHSACASQHKLIANC